MTKTLTEQWYDNTIDRSHHYYVRIKGKEEMNCGGIDFIDIIRPPLFRDQLDKLMKYNDPEVLAPVPSYEEYQGLLSDNLALDEAAEINAELEAQLKDANKCIKHCSTHPCCEKYLKKWGVK